MLLVGDSIAGSLGVGLAQYAERRNVQIVDAGTPGCSLSMETEIRVLFYSLAPGAPCDLDGNPSSLFETWRTWVDAYNPDVVVYVARGETFDQQVGGEWQNLTRPAFAHLVESRIQQGVDALGSKGAAVVLLTTPYYSSGTSPSGTAWPEDDPTRVQIDNATMRSVVRQQAPGPDGGKVYVYDLNAVVSPGHRSVASVDQGERALCGRRALLAFGRHLRRASPGAGPGGAGPATRIVLTGWRLAGASATIDTAMVP